MHGTSHLDGSLYRVADLRSQELTVPALLQVTELADFQTVMPLTGSGRFTCSLERTTS